MGLLLGILGLCSFGWAAMVYMNATSVMHQQFAATLGVAGAVFIVGLGIVETLKALPITVGPKSSKDPK